MKGPPSDLFKPIYHMLVPPIYLSIKPIAMASMAREAAGPSKVATLASVFMKLEVRFETVEVFWLENSTNQKPLECCIHFFAQVRRVTVDFKFLSFFASLNCQQIAALPRRKIAR